MRQLTGVVIGWFALRDAPLVALSVCAIYGWPIGGIPDTRPSRHAFAWTLPVHTVSGTALGIGAAIGGFVDTRFAASPSLTSHSGTMGSSLANSTTPSALGCHVAGVDRKVFRAGLQALALLAVGLSAVSAVMAWRRWRLGGTILGSDASAWGPRRLLAAVGAILGGLYLLAVLLGESAIMNAPL